jgi:[acyl-carrier-protein] S-malonyltransferase
MMSKIALMFPGQGSQSVGMGKDLYEKYQKAKEIIDLAGDDLKKIIFEWSKEDLRLTKYTQLAIFTVTMAAFEVFKDTYGLENVEEVVAAGHSVGEYSSLCAAGAFDFKDGLSMVEARGEFLQKASELNPGIMAAIIGLDVFTVESICRQVSNEGVCEAVLFNSPVQIVISGATAAVNRAVELASMAGAARIVILNVSGPFHSSLMSSAADDMAKELEKYNFNKLKFGVYTNCDAFLTTDVSLTKEKLVRQIKSPVKWSESIKNIISRGFDIFIEIGPGRVLSGLLRRIDRSKKVLNIEDCASLKKTLEELNK